MFKTEFQTACFPNLFHIWKHFGNYLVLTIGTFFPQFCIRIYQTNEMSRNEMKSHDILGVTGGGGIRPLSGECFRSDGNDPSKCVETQTTMTNPSIPAWRSFQSHLNLGWVMRANATTYYNAWMIGILNIIPTCHPNMVIPLVGSRPQGDQSHLSRLYRDHFGLERYEHGNSSLPRKASQNRWIHFGINELINCTIGLCLERAWNMGSCLVVDFCVLKICELVNVGWVYASPRNLFPLLRSLPQFFWCDLRWYHLVVLYII